MARRPKMGACQAPAEPGVRPHHHPGRGSAIAAAVSSRISAHSAKRKSLMKKVRYAGVVGALGVIPALALTTPAATAATRTHASTRKVVSLIHTDAATAATAASSSPSGVSVSPGAANPPCNARKARAHTSNLFGILTATIHYSRDIGCIGQVHGVLQSQDIPGLLMRVRSYVNGRALPQKFLKGHIHGSNHSITYTSYPHQTGVTQVCEAIVFSTSPTKPVAGPICEQTGF